MLVNMHEVSVCEDHGCLPQTVQSKTKVAVQAAITASHRQAGNSDSGERTCHNHLICREHAQHISRERAAASRDDFTAPVKGRCLEAADVEDCAPVRTQRRDGSCPPANTDNGTP